MAYSYDEAIKRIQQIVSELEQSQALSMDDYQTKAKEAKQLLIFCQKQLTDWEQKMEDVIKLDWLDIIQLIQQKQNEQNGGDIDDDGQNRPYNFKKSFHIICDRQKRFPSEREHGLKSP